MMNYQYNNSGGSINDGGGPPSSKKKKQKSSSNKKTINRACKECHQSKNKCEYTTNGEKRCDRCIRLKRECVPHQSRQGQRKQRSSASSTVDSSSGGGGGDEIMEDTTAINNNNNINMYNNQGNILLDNNRVESSVVNNGSIILQPPSLPQVPSQQQQQALPQQNLNSSESSSSASVLLKCLSMNNGNNISGGGSANHNNNTSSSSMDYNSMLSNLDPATLNLMIRQLSSSSSHNNNTNNNNNVSNALLRSTHNQQQQQQHQQQHHQQQQQLNNLAYGVGVSGDPTSCSNYPASALLMLAGAGSHLTAVAPQQGSNNTPILNNNNLSHTTTNTNLHLHTTTNNNFNNTNHNNNPGGSSGIGIGVGINSILNTSGLMGGTNNDIISTGLLLGGGGGGVGGGGRRSSDGDQPSSSSAANMAASSSLSTRHHIGKRATICSSTPTSGGIIESLHTTNNTNTNNATILCNTVGNKHGMSQQGGVIASSTTVGGGDGNGIISESLLKKQKKAHLLPLTTTTEQQYQHQPAAHYQYPSISLMSHIPSTENLTSLSDVAASAMMVARQSELGSESINVSRNNNGNDNSNGNSTTTNNIMSRNSSTQNFVTPEDAIGKEIGRAISKNSGKSLQNLKNHYGLQCQIREWISMALTRRSFALLGKASSLANRCGIHMDRILCGVNDDDDDDDDDDDNGYVNISVSGGNDQSLSPPQRMNYLLATLLEPRARQTLPVKERFMLKPNLPKEFLSIVGCQNNPSFHDHNLRNRWIIIRETHKGITSFYCSPAFERNVLCWTHISQIYEDNLADINSLIFVKDDFRKFLACNAHQISAHSKEGMPPCPVHAPKTRIRLLGRQWGQASYTDPSMSSGYITKEMIRNVQDLGNVKTCEMDLRFVSFPTMDKTTYYLEFFHHSGDGSSSMGSGTASGLSSWARNMSNDSLLTKTGATATATAADDTAGAAGSSTINVAQQPPQQQQQHQQQTEQIVSESPGTEEPPTFDDIIGCEELGEEWVGINDIVASGDIDDLITALLD